ncbi:hypothetical protein T06_7328 [Trichinella sp. T6]|nr:hypothetical protein T06_7328 [Trichinella sp. T6]
MQKSKKMCTNQSERLQSRKCTFMIIVGDFHCSPAFAYFVTFDISKFSCHLFKALILAAFSFSIIVKCMNLLTFTISYVFQSEYLCCVSG